MKPPAPKGEPFFFAFRQGKKFITLDALLGKFLLLKINPKHVLKLLLLIKFYLIFLIVEGIIKKGISSFQIP